MTIYPPSSEAEDGGDGAPHNEVNLYREDLGDHAAAVHRFVDLTLTPSSDRPEPCANARKKVDEGGLGVSSSDHLDPGLETLGRSVKTALSNYGADVDAEVNAEPASTLVPGPDSWKAT